MTRTDAAAGARHHPSRARTVLALAAAAILRFWALPHGIPYSLGVDEPEVMERAVRMIKTGDFNPHFFDYPSLYIYVQAVVAAVRFMFGRDPGTWSALAQAPTEVVLRLGRAPSRRCSARRRCGSCTARRCAGVPGRRFSRR